MAIVIREVRSITVTPQKEFSQYNSRVLTVNGLFAECQARPNPERVADLTASDRTKLKATYFGAAKPGPGVLLLHQQPEAHRRAVPAHS